VIIATEPKELTIVSIIGSIRPEDVRDLGGHLGIPKLDMGPVKKDKNDKEDEK